MTLDGLGWPWLRTPEATRVIDAARDDFARVDRELADKQRPCPYCDRQAWFESDGPDGLRSFLCANGHQMIVAPVGDR